jgi:hypothetical protein
MIKSVVKHTAIFIALVAVIASCGKKPKQLNYIPKDVSGVIAIDGKQLAMKSLELKDLLNMDLFKKNIPGKDSVVDIIKNSGVDLLNTAYIFGDVAKGEQKMYIGSVFVLGDEAKFEKTLKERAKVAEVKSDNDIKYAFIGNDNIVGWKDQVAISLTITGETDQEKYKAKLKSLFTQPEENSLAAANEKFKALLKEEADLSIYLNYEKLEDLIKQTSAQLPIMVGNNFKDTYLTSTINFENGKILLNTKLYNNEENTKKAKELFKASVAGELVKGQPGGDVVAFASFALNMEGIIKQLKEAGLLEGVNQGLQSLGPEFDANYVAAALSGDLLATLNNVNLKEGRRMDYYTGDSVSYKRAEPEYAVSIGIKDAAKFQKLLDAVIAKSAGAIVKNDKYYSALRDYFFVTKDNALIFVSSAAIAGNVAANKITPLDSETNDVISSNTMSFGLNISKLKPGALDAIDVGTAKIVNILPIESIVFSAEEVKSDIVTAKTVVNFKNKEQNSLISLQQTLKESDKFMLP